MDGELILRRETLFFFQTSQHDVYYNIIILTAD